MKWIKFIYEDMSSGNLSINLYYNNIPITLEGEFVNGHIVQGSLRIDTKIMTGQFNQKMQLCGTNCTMSSGYCTRRGVFSDGVFIDGQVFDGNKLVEEGIFNGNNLVNGTRYLSDGTKINGLFKHNRLESGSITFPDGTVHQGTFDYSNKLLNGVIYTPNGFTAQVLYTQQRTLIKCLVNYAGDINALSPSQLRMYCCSSDNPTVPLQVYDTYLHNLSVPILMLLNCNFINLANISERLGLMHIINNLQLAKENKPMMHILDKATTHIIQNTDPLNLDMEEHYDSHS